MMAWTVGGFTLWAARGARMSDETLALGAGFGGLPLVATLRRRRRSDCLGIQVVCTFWF